MNKTSSRLAEPFDLRADIVVKNRADRLKLVNQRMPMFILHEASLAQVEVRAILARHKRRSWEL
jgi:hypothetical protein